jgi:amino acid permease
MSEENLILDDQNDEKNNEQNNDKEAQKIIHKENENNDFIEPLRETKDSVQIHEEPNIADIDEEYTEKCYSMKEGSILGGVFALSSLALGTGAFSIPIRCTQLGCVWYIILIFVGASAAYWTLTGLIRSSRVVRGLDYSPTVRGLVGNCAGVFIDVVIIVYLFGVFVQYMVIIYSLIGRSIFDIFGDTNEYENFEKYEEEVWDSAVLKYPIMFGTTLIIFPVCLLKDISKMRFASMFGICALIYSILVVVIESPWYLIHYLDNYKEDDPSTHANWFDITQGFTKELNFFTGVATVFFTFTCHPGAFPVFKTLKNHTEKRINTCFFRSVLLDVCIYVLIAICGFITAPLKSNAKSLIIYRESIFENDIPMTIAKIALALDLFLSLPANFASYRCSFFMVFFKTDKIDNFKNFLVTGITLFLSTLVGALYKNILSYISFFGGFCSSIICYLIPGILMIRASKKDMKDPKNIITIILILLMTVIGWMGGLQTIRSIINGTDK